MTNPQRLPRDEARALAALFAPGRVAPAEPPSLAAFTEWTEAKRAELGLSRPPPLATALAGDEPDDPRELAYWLLRMAAATYARLLAPLPPVHACPDRPAGLGDHAWPPVDGALVRRLEALLAERPGADEAHCQMPIDAESALRRALVALERAETAPGPILALGDDDAVTVALALLGAKDLVALDIDRELLDFLEASVRRAGGALRIYERDLFEDELPEALVERCGVVLTDPVRSFGPCLAFLDVAERCLAPGPRSVILYADHPDWNFELDRVLGALGSLGLRCAERIELIHRYPLTKTWVPDPEGTARALGLDPAWLEELLGRVAGFTHLHVLERTRTPG